MKILKILLLIFWSIPPLIFTYLLIPSIIPGVFAISKIKSPDGKYTAVVQDEQYGMSFDPANYTVDIKFRAALLHYKKVRIFEADDELNKPPEVTWKDSHHLNIKIFLKDKNYIRLQTAKLEDIYISYDFKFKNNQ